MTTADTEQLSVRELTKDDIPVIVRMASDLHDEVEAEWPGTPPFNEQLVFEQIWQCMYIKMMHAAGLFCGDRCVGVLVFTVYPCFGVGDVLGKEAMWYVVPEYRSGGGGLMLEKAFERIAKERGAGYLELGHFTMVNGERMARLCCALGFTPHQLRYIKEC